MHLKNWSRCCLAAVLATLLVGPAGCKAEKPKVKLPAGLTALQAEAQKGKTQVSTTVAALDKLLATAKSGGDLKASFEAFGKEVAAMEAQSAETKKKADDMRARGAEYFQMWEKEIPSISTPAIKEQAEKTRAELTKAYEAVTKAAEEARDAYAPLMTDLKDMQKALANDLNPAGVTAFEGTVTKMKAAAKTAGEKLDAAVKAADNIGAIYSATN